MPGWSRALPFCSRPAPWWAEGRNGRVRVRRDAIMPAWYISGCGLRRRRQMDPCAGADQRTPRRTLVTRRKGINSGQEVVAAWADPAVVAYSCCGSNGSRTHDRARWSRACCAPSVGSWSFPKDACRPARRAARVHHKAYQGRRVPHEGAACLGRGNMARHFTTLCPQACHPLPQGREAYLSGCTSSLRREYGEGLTPLFVSCP